MRHKLCLDVVSEAPPERAASTHVRRGNSLYGIMWIKLMHCVESVKFMH